LQKNVLLTNHRYRW